MRTVISKNNPFAAGIYGFVWEKLRERPQGKHLDYGAFDGSILRRLIETQVIAEGTGVDLNKTSIMASAVDSRDTLSLLSINKGEPLPFEKSCFDSVSMIEVLEHVYDQQTLLKDINRVLRKGGVVIITVPKRHIFSVLDAGNFKFLFPRIHRFFYELFRSEEEYNKRYIQCEYGLFGDIEVEKMWHQHFSEDELRALLMECGFDIIEFDASGLFFRFIIPFYIVFPFMRKLTSKLCALDAVKFHSSSLCCVAAKQ